MRSSTKVSLVCVLFLAACSGAKETELFGPAAQGASGTTPIGGSSEDDAGSAPSRSEGPSDEGAGESGGGSGGSSSSSSGGGHHDDAGAPPPPPAPACTKEVEPNNEANRATAFTSCVDGSLKKSDVDFVEIVAPPQTTKITITHEDGGGKIAYRAYINGMPFPAFTGDAPDYIPAVTGATYRFQIQPFGSSNATRTYRLTVTFE
jgi:hypothetical protein